MAINLKVVNIDKQDKDYNRIIHQRYPDVKLFIQVGNDSIKTKNEDELLAHLLERYEWLIDQVMFDESLKDVRSEERRVGKECRCGWGQYQEKEKRELGMWSSERAR